MARYETNNWTGTAYAAVADRIHKSEEYKRARIKVVGRVAQVVEARPTVDQMLALGGFSKIVLDAIEAEALCDPQMTENMGSMMIPMTVEEVLRQTKESIREEAHMLGLLLAKSVERYIS